MNASDYRFVITLKRNLAHRRKKAQHRPITTKQHKNAMVAREGWAYFRDWNSWIRSYIPRCHGAIKSTWRSS